jgi:hypothetical protein
MLGALRSAGFAISVLRAELCDQRFAFSALRPELCVSRDASGGLGLTAHNVRFKHWLF